MSIAQKLADMGQLVEDDPLGVILLSGLTADYDSLVITKL